MRSGALWALVAGYGEHVGRPACSLESRLSYRFRVSVRGVFWGGENGSWSSASAASSAKRLDVVVKVAEIVVLHFQPSFDMHERMRVVVPMLCVLVCVRYRLTI